MTHAEQDRLATAIEEVHLDEWRHADPCGDCLIELLKTVEQHTLEEKASIDVYARMTRETPDPVIATVMQLLLEDEQHHHQRLARIATSLRDQLNWASESTALPAASWTRPDAETAGTVRALADGERRGARALRQLASSPNAIKSSLVCVLLKAMAMDSDKHARLLDFVAHRLA